MDAPDGCKQPIMVFGHQPAEKSCSGGHNTSMNGFPMIAFKSNTSEQATNVLNGNHRVNAMCQLAESILWSTHTEVIESAVKKA
ncbi:hypothetical protein FRC11_012326 [Ceratobasidium sp. 423]|nr:hypothetical protein FRC11_012326 [Ceratobasidium sp. 423]